jgi:hypothetical protein
MVSLHGLAAARGARSSWACNRQQLSEGFSVDATVQAGRGQRSDPIAGSGRHLEMHDQWALDHRFITAPLRAFILLEGA